MSRIKVTAIICDVCGNRIKDEDAHTVTTVTIKGPDSNSNGTFDICLNDLPNIAQAVGVGGDKKRTVPTTRRGGKREPWTEAELNNLREEYALGIPVVDIAKNMGRSDKSIHSKINALGLRQGANA